MSTARWVIVGAGGRVGSALRTALDGQRVRNWTRADADLADRERVLGFLTAIQAESADPMVCVNTAAVADVDSAERDPATADVVNAQAPGWLAEALAPGDLLVHLSTDYVFGADPAAGSQPYDESAPTAPLSVYGRTKRDGETVVLAARPDSYVVRTSWVFDSGKPNFVTFFRDRILSGQQVEAVTDQVSRPTATADLVAALLALVERRPGPGIYHCTNNGQASRYDVAVAVAALLGADPALVRGVSAAQVPPRPAVRPTYSVLGMRRWLEAGLPEPRSWRSALAEVLRRAP
ncbi:MAG: dTDP-4-dehydrorhamnose reductase [Actinomycetota bacterium]|nr:dTDP-4-dehydrorhamnose reductase [Actinomycetota bacterium]